MFDANMRYLPRGHKFIADVWGLKDTSPLAAEGVKPNTLILCTMLEDDHDNPSVKVHFPSGKELIVQSHDASVKGGLYMHHVIYYGTVTEEEELVDFVYDRDYIRAEEFMKSFKG